jgi:oxazoline/thiazoline dehydrogenase
MSTQGQPDTLSRAIAPTGPSDMPQWMAHVKLEMERGIHLSNTERDRWTLAHPQGVLHFRLPPGIIVATFRMLSRRGCRLLDLLPLVDESTGALSLREQLQKLWRYGFLTEVLYFEERAAASLTACGETSLIPDIIRPSEPVILSEYSCMHKCGETLVLETTEFSATMQVRHARLMQAATALVNPMNCDNLARCVQLPEDTVMAFVALLLGIEVVRRADTSSSQTKNISGWAFADRLLHARSRLGRHVGGFGGTFPLRGTVEHPSALACRRGGESVQLPVPDLAQITARDRPFTSVLEQRRSLREHSAEPISSGQLGEFLYRTARVTEVFQSYGMEFIKRPFPSGGGLYEIEFYLVVNRCEGVKSSLYRYDGQTHCLEHISDPSSDTKAMLVDAMRSSGCRNEPHVLIVLSARFLRVNWKYESIAYSVILKNVGVIYQTMYLVAAAMGLAPCALGGGSAISFCRATGSDYWDESAVGEFMVGRPAA